MEHVASRVGYYHAEPCQVPQLQRKSPETGTPHWWPKMENATRMHLIEFVPIFQQRVWGGRQLAEKLGRALPGGEPIGESWEIVDRPEAQSVCSRTGKTLRELLETDGNAIMGPGHDPERPFPILVKWLDCRDRLSLQVHPPATVAKRLGGEPKTECWYLADTTPNAALIVGLRRGVTRQQFEQAIEEETLEPLLHRFPVQPGESILLESGRLHAIDAGNLILEIQQNSDTTYRVYDWGRKGLDGKPRQLHVEQSLQSIDFTDFEPAITPASEAPGEITLAECAEFRIRRFNLAAGQQIPADRTQAMIFSVVRGEMYSGDAGTRYRSGTNLLAPRAWTGFIEALTDSTVLVTDRFG